MSPRDLKAYKIYEGEFVSLDFVGGINVSGKIITGTRNLQGRIILITLESCKVTHQDKTLFESKGELYNMAIGEEIVSAYHGPADLKSFDLLNHEISSSTLKSKENHLTELESFYKQIRDYREGKNATISRTKVFQEVQQKYPKDWLLSVEIYELALRSEDKDLANNITIHLDTIKLEHPKVGQLIDDGSKLASNKLDVMA